MVQYGYPNRKETGGSMKLALKCDHLDNVATIFANDVRDQDAVEVRDKMGESEVLTVIGDVPYGHKIALTDLNPGDKIMKYGECIGAANAPIRKGEYVHVHNMDALRGRGDLNG